MHQPFVVDNIPSSPQQPTDDAIEAVIQQATSSNRSLPELSRHSLLKDTRTQLFVGNLPYRVRWQDLKDLFRKAGTVLRADVSLGPDNRSRGHGTVLLASAEDAGRAVDMFNGYSWQNRILEVRLDRLLPDFDPVSQYLGSVPGYSTPHSMAEDMDLSFPNTSSLYDSNSYRNLFVGNLPFHCQWQDLKDLFRQAGTVLRADVALGPDGRSRGYGSVIFASEHDAERAVKMFNGYEYNGRPLKVHAEKIPPTNQLLSSSLGGSVQTQVPMHSYFSSGRIPNVASVSLPESPREIFTRLQLLPRQQQQLYRTHQSQEHSPRVQHRHNPILSHKSHVSPSSLDLEGLTQSLAASHVSKPAYSSKPFPTTTASLSTTSSSSTTTTRSSSERSVSSSSASSISQSLSRPPSSSQVSQQQYSQAYHPHHPGPISLPPPPIINFNHAGFSPSQHPVASFGMGSPYHPFPTVTPLHHRHVVHPQPQQSYLSLTPQGLPPITPSMPPFTFLPPVQRVQPASPSRSTSSTSRSGSNSNKSDKGPSPRTFRAASAPSPRRGVLGLSNLPPPSVPIQAQGQPSPLHLNLSNVHGAFSPGLSMSPGTFYGRAGEVPNPFINAAVGAPIHPQQQAMYSPGHPATHGAYFYAMSSPHHGAPTSLEPKGYFDPMYFPAAVSPQDSGTGQSGTGPGRSALSKEIMKGDVGGPLAEWSIPNTEKTLDTSDAQEQHTENIPLGAADVESGREVDTSRLSRNDLRLQMNLTSWHASNQADTDSTPLSRAHSLSSSKGKRRAREDGQTMPSLMHKPGSDPSSIPEGKRGEQRGLAGNAAASDVSRSTGSRRAPHMAWKSPKAVVEAAIAIASRTQLQQQQEPSSPCLSPSSPS